MKRFTMIMLAVAGAALSATTAVAAEGLAHPWQLNFQPAASPQMEKLVHMHNWLLVLITLISVFVLGVMAYICIRFNKKRNPVPSKVTHNNKLEFAWTVIPTIIIFIIGFFSWPLHYYMETVPDDSMTLKIVGYQWYWHYEYPEQDIGYDSYMKKDADLQEGEIRLLTVDNPVVLPVNTNIRVQLTAADVIHAWAMPAMGVKRDAVPGRLNETWFRPEKEGTYYGQCSELCGVGHGFMPIVLHVVSKEAFDEWVASKKTKPAAGASAPAKAAEKASKPIKPEGATPQVSPEAARKSPSAPATDAAAKKPASAPENRDQNPDTSSDKKGN